MELLSEQAQRAVWLDVMSTLPEAIGDLPDEAVIVAAVYAAEHDEAFSALMLGVEIGMRDGAEGEDGARIAQLTDLLRD